MVNDTQVVSRTQVPRVDGHSGQPTSNHLNAPISVDAGDSEYLNKEEEIPRLVRAEESKVGADVPDDVIMKRFRNIIACSSKLPSGAAARWEQMKADRPMHMMNKKERRHAKRKAAALAAEVAAAKK